MKVHLHVVDIAIILIYFVCSIVLSFIVLKKNKHYIDYILCGRRLTLPLFVGTLVSTWYGGILGVSEISYNQGAFYNWITQGATWYVSYFIFAFFLAGRIRETKELTIPEQLESFYGSTAGKIGVFLNYSSVIPSAYILSLGVLMSIIFNISPLWGMILALAVASVYSTVGGLWGVVYTDFLQFILMCVGVALMMIFSVTQLGGWDYLVKNLPETHFTLLGTWPKEYSPSIQNIIIWGFIAMITLVDPNFYQRCWAAKSPKVARNGVLLSIFFWCLFDICTSFIGMYARAKIPDLPDGKMAFPLLADQLLPLGLKGLFFTGMLATVMSTIDSFAFVAATSLSNDVYKRYWYPEASDKHMLFATKIGVLITFVLAFAIAHTTGSIKLLWKIFGSIGSASLLVPLLTGIFRKTKAPNSAGVASMVFGFTTVVVWMGIGKFELLPYTIFYEIEALYPGLLLSGLSYLFFCWWDSTVSSQQERGSRS
ncbi:MAG: sodium:solute symporter family protein [Deltaproteobacteria bacterium]|nr:sodium:solute symporter family protein [Deltaproteobacteria bacterium]